MEPNDATKKRLTKIFYAIIEGKDKLNERNRAFFLQAICIQPDPVVCVNKIFASEFGLGALQEVVRMRQTPEFFNIEISPLLTFLQARELKNLNGGTYLDEIVLKLVDPPFFWNAFRTTFLSQDLNEKAQTCLGWLLHQLCCLPNDHAESYRTHPDTTTILKYLLSSATLETRNIGQKLKKVLDTFQSVPAFDTKTGAGPGGRHDNDHEDFRKIVILPTAEELGSTEPAFLRPADVLEDPSTASTRVAMHLDNQFRLLREDMIYEMREELHVALGKKMGGFHRGLKITGLIVLDIECGAENKRTKWGLVLQCPNDLPQLKRFGKDIKARKDHLDNSRGFLKHLSFACIMSGNEIIAFPTIFRDEDRLAKFPPEIVLQFEGPKDTVERALQRFRMDSESVTLIQIDTAIFAYEPILKRLQDTTTLALSPELLLFTRGSPVSLVSERALPVIQALQRDPNVNLQDLLETKDPINLDSSQCKSLLSGLTQQLSLLQGPPGTGKSFIGALLAKAIYLYTKQTILVVCYTNHALDDILSGLLNIGIPEKDMLRLGGKSTAATEPLKLQNQNFRGGNRTREQWTIIDKWKADAESHLRQMQDAFQKYNAEIPYNEFMDYLQFEFPMYFEAFSVPESGDGMTMIGRGGRQIQPSYLIYRWHHNYDAGNFRDWSRQDPGVAIVWAMPRGKRQEMWKKWEHAIVHDLVEVYCTHAQEYNRIQDKLTRAQSANNVSLFEAKRIIGCTTTAAAKYCEDIQAFSPKVLLVEEAGEILESHILTALGPETSQVILIGDHKQLRPKVNNYVLTIEKGEGYDLNRSLFERLILKQYPHETLNQQHRMRPEISSLIRKLTYPELVDAPSTLNRPDILGLQDNIILIDHNHQEDDFKNLAERRDSDATSSKQNSFETEMILTIVKYLGQQGYGTDDLVILTPYLGQLHNLRNELKKDNDTILSDLDSYELVRAGLINSSEAKLTKKAIRLATIDNYQGEECDIVIVSLTRSNPNCDIGFMFSPERLNVLLSRSRNGLIMIGNMDTFMNARNPKGKELWTRLFNDLRHEKHIYEGLPIKCEKHPDRTLVLSQPEQFDDACPDGGCNEPCGVRLSCGVHLCPLKCHQLSDHSKMACKEETFSICPNRHTLSSICSNGPPKICLRCDREGRLAKIKQEKDAEAKKKRDANERAHLEQMDALNTRWAEIQRAREDERLARERAVALKQKEDDLAAYIAIQPCAQPVVPASTLGPHASGSQHPDPVYLPPDGENISPPMDLDGLDSPGITAAISNSSTLLHSDGASGSSSSGTAFAKSKSIAPKPFPQIQVSQSYLEWMRQKNVNGTTNPHVDAIMDMTGLEKVKKQLLETIAKIEASKRQNASLTKERFNVVFLGNPGTGKTTVARHYAKFLASMGVTPGSHYVETTGSSLANEGVSGAKKIVDDTKGGGTIFIDEAYQLTSGHSHGGAAVLDFLLAEMENCVGTIVFILAGYNKEMEKFFEHNPGLMSRVPHQLKFEDYKDEELMAIFEDLIKKTFQAKMKVEGGVQGLYGRIVIRRLARRRGHPGFGNARNVQTTFDQIRGRQAERLNKLRKAGGRPDDFTFSAEDLIGPNPSKVMGESKAWNRLQGLIGLGAVKKSVTSLLALIQENYQRELLEREPIGLTLNRVFLGSPGTGKTTVAKLYGQILVDLGMLSNGEVVIKNPSDFIGAALGASEANTKAILANTVGKVLVIDEAYMLYEGGGESGGQSNQFKTTVIDTMVAEIQSVPGEDRCVLLLGYTDQMLNMFQHVNPGLSRRFKIEDAFRFEDFDDAELRAILDLKLKEQDLDATEQAKKVAIGLLSRGRNLPNFGNAGEVENIISKAKIHCMARRAEEPISERPSDIVFSPEDFDPDHNRAANASANLFKLFEDIVGRQDVIDKLRNFQEISRACKERNMDPRELIPTNFVFTGPPGTGKTTIARKVGQVFYDMDFLGSAEVVECSASDLVGQYVGQTGPKTKKLFEKALGKVLFIDEAYRLGEGHFAQEAIDEVVGLVTQPRFKSKLVIILAGYENDMNKLMTSNAGLSSRFPDQITFENMDAESCISVVEKELAKKGVIVEDIDNNTSMLYTEMKEIIRDMSELNDWGNARDMIKLSKDLINLALGKHDASATRLEISGADVLGVMKKLLTDRQRRSKIQIKPRRTDQLPQQTFTANPPTPPPVSNTTDTHVSSESVPDSPRTSRSATPNSPPGRGRGQGAVRGRGRARATGRNPPNPSRPGPSRSTAAPSEGDPERDPGVSDAIWQQLSAAKRAALELERKAANEVHRLKQAAAKEKAKEAQEKKALEDLQKAADAERDIKLKDDLLRQREQARLKAHNARVAREKAEAALRAKQEAERKRKEQEEKAQRKLREMGVCPVGFRWINVGSYYRCAGGSHVVPIDSLGL